MKYYIPEMFDINNVEGFAADLLLQRETFAFQLNVFETNLNKFKKLHFKEILIYEKQKINNPELRPTKDVLKIIKALETDPSVKIFKQNIARLSREIKNIDTKINNEKIRISNMFKFDEYDVRRFLYTYLDYKAGTGTFDNLMELVFNTQFNSKRMYYEVAGLRNFDILKLLHSKAPQQWKKVIIFIINEANYVFLQEEIALIETAGFELIKDGGLDVLKLAILIKEMYQKKLDDLEKI